MKATTPACTPNSPISLRPSVKRNIKRHGFDHAPKANGNTDSASFGTFKDLPIRGRAQGGDDGNLVIEEQPIDWTFRPADLQGVHGAFAVFVTGDSMEPKYKDRDLAYIHPTLHVRRGRYVLVETSKHCGFIKQFDRWDGDTLVVKQFNPEREIRIAREEVRKVMMVIGSLDA